MDADDISHPAGLNSVATSSSMDLVSSNYASSADLNSSTAGSNNVRLTTTAGEIVDVLCPVHFASPRNRQFSDLSQSASHLQPGLSRRITGISHDTLVQPSDLAPPVSWPYRGYGIDTEDYDPEGIHVALCITPTMDRNLRENTLPFVLQCYAQWAIVAVFEPLKIVGTIKERVVQQFSSENTRTTCILMANVMDVFGKQLMVDETRLPIITYLTSEVGANSSSFVATQPPEPFELESDKQNAMRILDSTLEITTLQIYTQPMAACIELMEEAAPVFRYACSEPPGQPLNLANILLESGINLRHYATIDVMTSTLTGRPTFFNYHVPFSLELCEQIFQSQENSGLYWLHGVPDQFILMIAWINSLCEIPVTSSDSGLVSQIERLLPQIRIAVADQGDSALRIGRMVVQECWRYAMFIYLYMALGRADASDPRVVHAQKGFMRLVKGIKPGRNPDAFLVSPIIIAGIATRKERDRDVFRRRVLNLREYVTPHTSGNDAWMQVEDVWARTRTEGRVAIWSDLRIACFRISGK
ncbi:fungal-specific transcription factor domain protein [Rhizoctonia solani AG-3 Rhs1AP]|nr:fungal-specific transcription factor domain protein [Rhizoctonia solani AG-3 Rhs1AP]KEP52218.1 fungal-specific transcription factor domain protein [Rhizoctonia solani 123E]